MKNQNAFIMKNLIGIILLGLMVSSCGLFQKPSMTKDQIDVMVAENEALKAQAANCKDLSDKLALARMQADEAMLKLANCEGGNSAVHIIVGAFKNSSYADNYSAEMKAQGHDGKIIAGPYSFNLVTASSYSSVKAALKDLSTIRDNVIDTAWIYIE
jgi:cell division protein FtsN